MSKTTPPEDDQNEGRIAAATAQVTEAASAATRAVSDATSAARDKAAEAVTAIRDRAADAAEAARERAASARDTTASTIQTNPLGVVAGGIAVGAVLGALLPKTARETQLLAPLADRAAGAAKQAFAAAKTAGQDKLDELGINPQAAREKVNQLVDSAAQAASSAGAAAKEAAVKG
jgi:ElaB/YqjD/DUF883 family membrane-anchored ribosome-binding protein